MAAITTLVAPSGEFHKIKAINVVRELFLENVKICYAKAK